MELDDFLLEAEDKMSKTEQVVVNEFAGVRTGKASPALVQNIMVEVYRSHMTIRELAGITTPEPRTLTVMAAEAAVGLALVVALFRVRKTVFVDEMKLLKG